MEKRPRRGLFVRAFCSHVLSGLSPDSVDKLSAVMRESRHRSPQPQRPNVVSEWARKRKIADSLI